MTTGDLPSRCSSGRTEAVLHIDIIEEILARLPVKHVLRCKLLSKTYYDLIGTQSFINKHLFHHRFGSKIVVVLKNLHDKRCHRMVSTLSSDESSEESQLFLRSIVGSAPGFDFTEPLGSCNGLLLLKLRMHNLTVCNHATRKYMSLPECMRMSSYFREALGFGYDAKSNDYKIVCIQHCLSKTNHGPFTYWIQIWNMSTNTWKQINTPMPSLFLEKDYVIPYYDLLVNGTLYWLAYAKDGSVRDAVILSFDLTNNTFGQVVLPKEVVERRCKYELTLIDYMGSLALSVSLPSGESRRWLDIWVMDGDESFWTKRFSIGPFPLGLCTTKACINGNFVLLRRSDIRGSIWGKCEFFLHDPHRNNVVTEATVSEVSIHTTGWSVTESLVSVGQSNDHQEVTDLHSCCCINPA